MPTLLEGTRQARAGLVKVQQANQLRHQLKAIQSRTADWSERKQKRLNLLTKSGYLSLPLAASTDLEAADDAARALCEQACELLRDANIESLSENELWRRLLHQADNANTLRAEAIRVSWRALKQDLGTPDSAATVTAREPETPHNAKALTRYRELYSEYAALARTEMPPDAQSAETLRQCVQHLRGIVATFTPTPDSVKLFLKAVGSGGAALELLTEEVLNWLKLYDDAARFVIKTRMDRTWP